MTRAIERPRRAGGVALCGLMIGFSFLVAPPSAQAQPQSPPVAAEPARPVVAGRFVSEQGSARMAQLQDIRCRNLHRWERKDRRGQRDPRR